MKKAAILVAALLTAQIAKAQEQEELPADAPKVMILQNGDYLFNKQAFDATNAEMSRLQGVERQHKAEQWATPVIIGLIVGVVAGAAVSVPVTIYLTKQSSK